MTSILQSKVRTVVVGHIRFWLLFTVLYFFNHFVKFIERILWNNSVIWQSVRGAGFFGSRCSLCNLLALHVIFLSVDCNVLCAVTYKVSLGFRCSFVYFSGVFDMLSQFVVFSYAFQTSKGYMKVSRHIAFEEYLDLTPYCTRFAWVCFYLLLPPPRRSLCDQWNLPAIHSVFRSVC